MSLDMTDNAIEFALRLLIELSPHAIDNFRLGSGDEALELECFVRADF